MDNDQPKVFICYAREDIATAKKFYHELKRGGVSPWMDKEDLLPGQPWKPAITQAIRNSQFVIVLLSTSFVSTRGYRQKELKHALAVLEEMPDGQIFLIPARLEDCVPTNELLLDLNWVDLFPDAEYPEGFRKILNVVCPEPSSPPVSDPQEDIAQLKRRINDTVPGSPEEHAILEQLVQGKWLKHAKEESAAPGKERQKRYNLRSEPLIVSEEECRQVFGVDDTKRPLKYIENEYEDQGDVIVDHATGLMWQTSGSEGRMRYKDTQAYVDSLNNSHFAGYTDWRLPTIPELLSLLEHAIQSNNLFMKPLFNTPEVFYWCWSADGYIKGESSSGAEWFVDFGDGLVDWYYIEYDYYVRAVRSMTN